MTQPNAGVTDAEKCRLLAEFENDGCDVCGVLFAAHRAAHEFGVSDYCCDLNATMRAARKLPKGIIFEMTWGIEPLGSADEERWIVEIIKRNGDLLVHISHADPARAAFEALAAYLEQANDPA